MINVSVTQSSDSATHWVTVRLTEWITVTLTVTDSEWASESELVSDWVSEWLSQSMNESIMIIDETRTRMILIVPYHVHTYVMVKSQPTTELSPVLTEYWMLAWHHLPNQSVDFTKQAKLKNGTWLSVRNVTGSSRCWEAVDHKSAAKLVTLLSAKPYRRA